MSEANQAVAQGAQVEEKSSPKVFYGDIVGNGLWKQNPGLVQLLGLCPTLAMKFAHQ